jgi:histidine triad (HIT) family protein
MKRLLHLPGTIRLIGWFFAHMNSVLPVHRLYETDTLIAFYHPNPSYPFHVLLVPKKALQKLEDLEPADSSFLTDLFSVVQSLIRDHDLAKGGYRLIVNGGKYQDFPQLHFHLISDVRISHA